jgi:hypothetical protein
MALLTTTRLARTGCTIVSEQNNFLKPRGGSKNIEPIEFQDRPDPEILVE